MSSQNEIDVLTKERDRYRQYLDMALREANAGNERMRNFAEGYALHLDRVVARLHAAKEPK